jgi:REP element-mobilizing transposase RayT
MSYDPARHHRRSIRLAGYDYASPGAYFITLCTQDRVHLFGEVVDGVVQLSPYGRVAATYWEHIPQHFPHVALGAWVIMPNHMHGLLIITGDEERAEAAPTRPEDGEVSPQFRAPESGSLGAIIGNYKSITTRRINLMRHTPGTRVWLRNYWESTLRSEEAVACVTRYITNNPARWSQDRFQR